MALKTSLQAFQAEGLTPSARRALEIFVKATRQAYGNSLLKIVLFGSRARGDAHPESDVDLAVVLKDIPDRGTVIGWQISPTKQSSKPTLMSRP